MARRSRAAAVQQDAPETTEPQVLTEQSPDVFDQAAEAAAAGQFEQPPSVPQAIVQSVADSTRLPDDVAREPEAQGGHAARHRPEGQRQFQPDPFGMESILLSEENDGPRARLFRNNRAGVLAIQFDAKPVGPEGEESKYLDTIRDAGFRWNQRDGVWTLPMDPEVKWQAHAKAEKTFREVANAIRQDKGLEPVAQVGM